MISDLDNIRAAVELSGKRTHKGTPAHIHDRTLIDVPEESPEPTPPPTVPSGRPVPVAQDHPDSRPEPRGGGIPPDDLRFDVDLIVDRVQSGTPSLAGYRDSPAVVRNR